MSEPQRFTIHADGPDGRVDDFHADTDLGELEVVAAPDFDAVTAENKQLLCIRGDLVHVSERRNYWKAQAEEARIRADRAEAQRDRAQERLTEEQRKRAADQAELKAVRQRQEDCRKELKALKRRYDELIAEDADRAKLNYKLRKANERNARLQARYDELAASPPSPDQETAP